MCHPPSSGLLTPLSEIDFPLSLVLGKAPGRLFIEINNSCSLYTFSPASSVSAGQLHHLCLSGAKSTFCINVVSLLYIQQLGKGQVLTVRRQQNTLSCLDFEFIPSINRKDFYLHGV